MFCEEELIRGWIRDYDPKAPSNSQLRDDFRVILAWHSSILKGRKLYKRVGKERKEITQEDCIDLGTKIVKEMIKRGSTFNKPETYKLGARKAFEKIIEKIGKEKIPWKDKELTITSPDVPMEPVIATKKKLLTDSQIRELNDEELRSYHDQLHIIEKVKAEDLDILAENHALVADELRRRGLKHNFDPKNKLDLKSKTYEQEYPKPWVELEKDLTLDEVLEAFPERIDLEGEPIQIFLIGRTVNTGICPKGHDIDVLFKIGYLDPKIAESFREQVARKSLLIERKLHLVLDNEGPLVGLAIPLYRSNEKVKRGGDELQKVEWGKPLGFMKPEKTCEFIHRFESVWQDWAEERIKDGIIVNPKYDGLAVELQKNGDRIWIITEDTQEDRAKNLLGCANDIKTKIKADTWIAHAELVWYKDEKFKEPHLRRDMIRFAIGKGVQDDKLVRLNIWDVIFCNGKTLWDLPCSERMEVMKETILESRHLHMQDWSLARNKAGLRKLIFKYAVFPDSEGAMLKTLDSKYRVDGTTRSREICLRGGTKILTENGFERIMDIKEGVRVFNEKGRLSKVTGRKRVDFQEHPESLVRLKIVGGIDSSMTESHRILTKEKGWVRAKESMDLEIDYPKLELSEKVAPEELKLEWHGYAKTIRCDEDFWKLIGFWLAEGHLGSNKKSSTYHRGEFGLSQNSKEVLEKYAKIIEEKLAIKPKIYTYGKHSHLIVWDKPFCDWLSKHFLDKNDDKTVPWFINSLPHSKFKAFLDGYVEGDGFLSKGGRIDVSTSDSGLAGRLFAILRNREDISLNYNKPRKGKGAFKLTFNKNFLKPHRISVEKEQMNGAEGIFDLQLEEGEGFCGGNVVFHNSKFKNLKEIDTIVLGKHQVVREGVPQDTYNHFCFIGPLEEGEKDIFPEDELKEFKGKSYAHIGTSYNYGEKLSDGMILTVAPVMVTWEEAKENKRKLKWMFPQVITHRPGKKEPDNLSFIKRVIAVGTKPLKVALELADKEIRLYLLPCPHQDNEEECILKKRMVYKFGQKEEESLEQTEVYQQFLQYPIRCPWSLTYFCPYPKAYYYSWHLLGAV